MRAYAVLVHQVGFVSMAEEICTRELLAPAGSRRAFEAAVAAGADAVYISGKQFGARAYAENFDDAELLSVIQDAHARGVLVYVTVNTLITEQERAAVASYLVYLYQIGADAVLVQDQGVLRIARRLVPDLPIHASTQMTIHSIEGVRYAAAQGITRVVLARELSLDEVRAIARDAETLQIETEIFAHGALCMGYSGQCLLSSVIGGRSGNRGTCAQPCRREYSPVIGVSDAVQGGVSVQKTKDWEYLLSPRDLAIWPRLSEITGVAALKIEGRMKSPEYVATVVSLYRQALDQIRSGTFSPGPGGLLPAAYTFTRGFTDGHLFGSRGGEFFSDSRPDHQGVRFGTVHWYDQKRHEAVVGDLVPPLPNKGDGIVFSCDGEEDVGCTVRMQPVVTGGMMRVAVPVPVKPGMAAAINKRAGVEKNASALISSYARGGGRKVTIRVSVCMDSDHLMLIGHLTGPRGDLITISAQSASPMAAAVTRPLSADAIIDLLSRTGETWFDIRIDSIAYPGGLFLPVKEITALRRELFRRAAEAMQQSCTPSADDVRAAEKRLRAYQGTIAEQRLVCEEKQIPGHPRSTDSEGGSDHLLATDLGRASDRIRSATDTPARQGRQPIIAVYADTLPQVQGAAAGGCTRVYYTPGRAVATCGQREAVSWSKWQTEVLTELRDVITFCSEHALECYWKFPDITRRSFLDHALPVLAQAHAMGINGVMVGSPGVAAAVHTLVPGMKVAGSSALNITNHEALDEMAPLFESVALSKELSRADLQALCIRAHETVEFFVQGVVSAMIAEHCIAYGRYPCPGGDGDRLLAIKDRTGRLFPVRSDPECRTLIGNAVETCLIDHLPAVLDAGVSVLGIDLSGRTEQYATAVCSAYRSALNAGDIRRLKEAIRSVSWGGITTGPFLSGGF